MMAKSRQNLEKRINEINRDVVKLNQYQEKIDNLERRHLGGSVDIHDLFNLNGNKNATEVDEENSKSGSEEEDEETDEAPHTSEEEENSGETGTEPEAPVEGGNDSGATDAGETETTEPVPETDTSEGVDNPTEDGNATDEPSNDESTMPNDDDTD